MFFWRGSSQAFCPVAWFTGILHSDQFGQHRARAVDDDPFRGGYRPSHDSGRSRKLARFPCDAAQSLASRGGLRLSHRLLSIARGIHFVQITAAPEVTRVPLSAGYRRTDRGQRRRVRLEARPTRHTRSGSSAHIVATRRYRLLRISPVCVSLERSIVGGLQKLGTELDVLDFRALLAVR